MVCFRKGARAGGRASERESLHYNKTNGIISISMDGLMVSHHIHTQHTRTNAILYYGLPLFIFFSLQTCDFQCTRSAGTYLLTSIFFYAHLSFYWDILLRLRCNEMQCVCAFGVRSVCKEKQCDFLHGQKLSFDTYEMQER